MSLKSAFGQDLVVYVRSIRAIIDAPVALPDGVDGAVITRDVIRVMYPANDPQRRGSDALLAEGYAGVVLHRNGQWRSSIWTATPATRQPLHLPASLRGLTWLIHGHTRAEFRNQGYLKLAIRLLTRHLADGGASLDESVYADVLTPNMPSRRSLLTMGFAPCGTLRTLRVPKTRWVWGRWEQAHPHPDNPLATPETRRCS